MPKYEEQGEGEILENDENLIHDRFAKNEVKHIDRKNMENNIKKFEAYGSTISEKLLIMKEVHEKKVKMEVKKIKKSQVETLRSMVNKQMNICNHVQ